MIKTTCPGCGDQHLCPGTTSNPPSPDALDALRTFIEATFTPNPIGYVSSSGAYLAYLNWCSRTGTLPISQRKFVPAMGILGHPRVKRSTMRLAGLSWQDSIYRGRHHSPEPVNAGHFR
jgi:phage/plasmid-associated DNA primase